MPLIFIYLMAARALAKKAARAELAPLICYSLARPCDAVKSSTFSSLSKPGFLFNGPFDHYDGPTRDRTLSQ